MLRVIRPRQHYGGRSVFRVTGKKKTNVIFKYCWEKLPLYFINLKTS